jgi:hypothetical protein
MFTPLCGNGAPDLGEQCDEGSANSNAPNASCRTDCTPARCGDGVLDDLANEQCDDGIENSDLPNASCRTDCTPARCGDGIVDGGAGEACEDDGGCSSTNECQDCECVPRLGTRTISASGLGIIASPIGEPLGPISGRLVLNAGAPDADGVAALSTPPGASFLSINVPVASLRVCHRITSCTGVIHCNGGVNAVVRTQLNSLRQGLTCQVATTPSACQAGGPCCSNACEGVGVGSGNVPTATTAVNSGTGTGGLVVLECLDSTVFGPLGTNCATLTTYAPDRLSVYTSGSSTAAFTNECPPDPTTNRLATVSSTGENFQCSSWTTENGPGRLLIPVVVEQPIADLAGDVSALIQLDD